MRKMRYRVGINYGILICLVLTFMILGIFSVYGADPCDCKGGCYLIGKSPNQGGRPDSGWKISGYRCGNVHGCGGRERWYCEPNCRVYGNSCGTICDVDVGDCPEGVCDEKINKCCKPACEHKCGQDDGCGGKCPDDDKNTCGRCGNPPCDVEERVPVKSSDFNEDGKVDSDDFFEFKENFNKKEEDEDFDEKYDLDESGVVDFVDFIQLSGAIKEEMEKEEEEGVRVIEFENRPPEISDIVGSREVVVGEKFKLNVIASDPDGDRLEYSLTTNPLGMWISANGQINSRVMGESDISEYTMGVRVKDSHNLFYIKSFEIEVKEKAAKVQPNRAPEIRNILGAKEKMLGEEFKLNVIASDPDGDRLEYSLTKKPGGMSIDSNNGQIKWRPTKEEDVGGHDVGVRVRDPRGEASFEDFKVNVKEIPEIIDCNEKPKMCFKIVERGGFVEGKFEKESWDISPYKIKCEDLKRGEKCVVEWRLKIDSKAKKGSSLPIHMDFSYDSSRYGERKIIDKYSGLSIAELGSGTTPSSSVIAHVIRDVTGMVVVGGSGESVTRIGRFNCVLKNEPEICCKEPFFRVSNDGEGCVYNGEAFDLEVMEGEDVDLLLEREELIKQIIEKMGEYLRTADQSLIQRIQELEDRLMA